ncbi:MULTISPECIES: hypothetical protein [Sphingobium]|uniref:hypothetical protein n=1 Tax=Sphingobium TaxID=165695 RepID=UPI0015ECB4EC|nr:MULTISPECIES: hypothetical protein [Sphingobium]MCW2363995.1 hypothetical protein [Sphingobium sp. B10D3B]MCW2402608.1 hypothetical protein [Sphingobium sp. B10D7B]MCW2409587.1 hypothetical protein [Sphingobium xanthum]
MTVNDLHSSQTFAVSAPSAAVEFDLYTLQSSSGVYDRKALTISYDAVNNSYTLTTPIRSQTFTPEDKEAGNSPNQLSYVIGGASSGTRDVLMIAHQQFSQTDPNQFVGFGYWQHDELEGAKQKASFSMFTYGFPTPEANIPRVGTAAWDIDLFGIANSSGYSPQGLGGSGVFNVDFLTGDFAATADVQIVNLVTMEPGEFTSKFEALGRLGSANSFAGTVLVVGPHAYAGSIEGQFFGPNAEEIGATILATLQGDPTLNREGFVGTITGRRNPNPNPINLNLMNLQQDLMVETTVAQFRSGTDPGTAFPAGTTTMLQDFLGQVVTLATDGSVKLTADFLPGLNATFASTDRVGQNSRFVTYQKTIDEVPTELGIFRPGLANADIALSYASFGYWSTHTVKENGGFDAIRSYFPYGFQTPLNMLAVKTGSAHYSGVVYGTGAFGDAQPFEVGGSSNFDFDFAMSRYTGALDLHQISAGGSAGAALGRWTISSGYITSGIPYGGGLVGPVEHSSGGSILPRFYGPNAEELVARFVIGTPTTGQPRPGEVWIAGVTVAKQD